MGRQGRLEDDLWRSVWTPLLLHRQDEPRENVDLSEDGTDPGGRRYIGLGRCPDHGNVWFVEWAKTPACEWCALEDSHSQE